MHIHLGGVTFQPANSPLNAPMQLKQKLRNTNLSLPLFSEESVITKANHANFYL